MFNNILKISNIPKTCRERYLNLDCEEAAALSSCGIHFSGVSYLRRAYQVGNPNPSESHMVIFTKSGEGYLHTRENKYALKRNSVITVPAGYSSMFGVKNDDWKILWFYMRSLPRWQKLSEQGIKLSDTGMMPDIENSMEAYLAESRSENGTPSRAASLHAELICIYLNRALKISDQPSEIQIRSLENIWKLVRDNPEKKWTLQEFASVLNISPSTFQRLVKRYYSTSTWQKVIQIRMEQAKMTLLNTDYPLKIIAEKLGYADEFVFSNAFKKFYGIFPRHYKEKIRAELQNKKHSDQL
ncbi:MAG: hypothetical protein A2017_16075 [Lentisphaerae bacterium GWF2_44_16]|nr:MAG: hypothetical protein A2017_16075 [Lentisphaerae bacterium GWF2_44_16]